MNECRPKLEVLEILGVGIAPAQFGADGMLRVAGPDLDLDFDLQDDSAAKAATEPDIPGRAPLFGEEGWHDHYDNPARRSAGCNCLTISSNSAWAAALEADLSERNFSIR